MCVQPDARKNINLRISAKYLQQASLKFSFFTPQKSRRRKKEAISSTRVSIFHLSSQKHAEDRGKVHEDKLLASVFIGINKMVMHVETRLPETSFLSVPEDIELVDARTCQDATADSSFQSVTRDTSNTRRDASLDNTRQTVNTHNSILDLTKDEEEDDDDDEDLWNNSVLFDDLQAMSQGCEIDEIDDDASPIPAEPTNLLEKLSFDKVTDSFVDSLCPGEVSKSTSCSPSFRSSCSGSTGSNAVSCYPQQRLQLSVDVWKLLGCAASAGDAEIDSIWSLKTSQVMKRARRPIRSSMGDRLRRIRRLRMDRVSGATRHGVTIAPQIKRANTMDDRRNDPLADYIGQGMEPIPHDGYDSDPEVGPSSPRPKSRETASELEHYEYSDDACEQDFIIQESVQQTLNSTWTLTWHPNAENMKEFGVSAKPICINIWMERGTVITSNGVVLEPSFMWRDAYQTGLTQHRLNESTQKPWTMRLLNTCRISEWSATNHDRDMYPLARPAHSLLLRTSDEQEFLLEASSQDQRNQVCERWKLAVARFASLAVTEDIDSIAREFFHPTCNSQMLTVNDP